MAVAHARGRRGREVRGRACAGQGDQARASCSAETSGHGPLRVRLSFICPRYLRPLRAASVRPATTHRPHWSDRGADAASDRPSPAPGRSGPRSLLPAPAMPSVVHWPSLSRSLCPPRALPRRPRPPPPPGSPVFCARNASKKPHVPWPDVPGPAPEPPKLRSWVAPVSRIANFLIIPSQSSPAPLLAASRARTDAAGVAQPPSSTPSSFTTSATTSMCFSRYVLSLGVCCSSALLAARLETPLPPPADRRLSLQPRRWLEVQKAAFFSLSPEEQKLAGLDGASSASAEPPAPAQGSPSPRR